jgi:RES domain-containing protein
VLTGPFADEATCCAGTDVACQQFSIETELGVLSLVFGMEMRRLEAWRLDVHVHAATWDRGIGAAKVGVGIPPGPGRVLLGRPSTAILEVAVHTGVPVLDTVPACLTSALLLSTGLELVAAAFSAGRALRAKRARLATWRAGCARLAS